MGRSLGRRRLSGLFPALILGAALIWLAIPRLESEVMLLPAREMVSTLRAGTSRSHSEIMVMTRRVENALEHSSSTDGLRTLAWLRILAVPKTTVADQEDSGEAARLALIGALVRAPINSRDWQELARLDFESARYLEAARAWGFSVRLAPQDVTMLSTRFESGLALWPYMDLETRAAFQRHVSLSWQVNPWPILNATRRFGARALVRELLDDGGERTRAFDRNFASLGPQ